jgi:hypothetical protein
MKDSKSSANILLISKIDGRRVSNDDDAMILFFFQFHEISIEKH